MVSQKASIHILLEFNTVLMWYPNFQFQNMF